MREDPVRMLRAVRFAAKLEFDIDDSVAEAIRNNVVPPTLNLDNPSVSTAIDLVPHQARQRTIDTVLSNSFGFGGTNASLVMRRYVS